MSIAAFGSVVQFVGRNGTVYGIDFHMVDEAFGMKTILFPPRRLRTTGLAAIAFLMASASDGQTGQPPPAGAAVPAAGQQYPEPVRPENLTCNELKAQLKDAGQLSIYSGPRGGWGDTFYGPAVPRCQFYQMPQFTYVRKRDGLCGVGYICIDKLSFD